MKQSAANPKSGKSIEKMFTYEGLRLESVTFLSIDSASRKLYTTCEKSNKKPSGQGEIPDRWW